MAFLLTNFSRQTVAMNAGLDSSTSPATAAPQIFSFMSTTDNAATVGGANYFASASYDLFVNDFIFCVCSDATVLLQVVTVDNTTVPAGVTTEVVGFSSSVGTANIQGHAVTYAKVQQAGADSLIGNPTSGTADVEEVTLGNALEFSGTTLRVPLVNSVVASGTLSSAQLIAMYGTPISLITAPGSGKTIVIEKFELEYVKVTTAYDTNGGSATLTYGSSAHAAAGAASVGIAFTGLTDQSVSTVSAAAGALTGLALSAVTNTAVYISNTSGALATGDGTAKYNIWYKVISA